MSQPAASRSRRIPELDGLRAFAVLCVVVFHMHNYAGSLPQGPSWVADALSYLGPSAVNVFFIISGYIITTLLIREQASTGQVSLRAFYIRRFFRIVPPFAVYLFCLFVLQASGVIRVSGKHLLWSALFLGDTNLLDPQAWFVAHTWSLAVEEQFYLLFPPLLCLVLGFRTRLVVPALGALYGLCLVSIKLAHELSTHLAPQWVNLVALYHFRYIIIGVLLATHGKALLAFLADRSRVWPLSFAVMAVLLATAKVPPVLTLLFAALEPCLCGLFVMWFMQNPSRCGLLRSPVIQFVGACSYSLYLWQQLFTASPRFYTGWSFAQSPLSVVAIVLCAAGSFYLIERPSIRLGRWLSRHQSIRRNDDKGGLPSTVVELRENKAESG